MLRCINLAERGTGYTKTNPRVGCMIVLDKQILAEGWHQYFGGMHAEAHALSLVPAAMHHLLPHSTLYVTLEPCNHFGKTPPCSHAIVKSGIKNVVIGCEDPNPLVSGKGIKFLRDAGIEVEVGVEKDSCEQLIKPFVITIQQNRPYIILKWAQSTDGYIGRKNESVWLSNSWSKRRVHQIRSQVDAILIGAGTVRTDNPNLDTRYSMGKSPDKIILDSQEGLTPEYTAFHSGTHTTLVSNDAHRKPPSENVETLIFNSPLRKDPGIWISELKHRNIGSLLVEGGSEVLTSFIDTGNWDEAYVIHCSVNLDGNVKAPALHHSQMISSEKWSGDIWYHYFNTKGNV